MSATVICASKSKSSSLGEGIRLILKSKYLIWILALVLLAQITVALIDYEYKRALRDWYLVQPERAYLTDLYSRINWQQYWLMNEQVDWSVISSSLNIHTWGFHSWGSQSWSALWSAEMPRLIEMALRETTNFYRGIGADISGFQGWVYLTIDIGSLLCQLLTGWIILNLGIAKTHLSIPMLLLVILGGAMIWPTILLIAAARSRSRMS